MIDLNLNPPKKDLRIFAAGQVVFFAFIAWRVYRHTGSYTPWPATIMAVSVIVGLIGCLIPSGIRWIYAAWMIAVFPIGYVVSHIMMGIAWYGVITPIALFRRSKGHDSLNHQLDPDATSYWSAREPADSKRYFKQF